MRGFVFLLLTAPACAQSIDFLDLARPRHDQYRRSSSTNPDRLSNDDAKRPIPGETLVLADLMGPGVVTHIWITSSNLEYGWPRLFRLRVFYDGSESPSVDTPLGDFFGSGHGLERDVQSQMVRVSSAGRSRNSYWPMPFRKSCRITVTNEGTQRPASFYYQVDWKKVASLPADTMYFHALYRQAVPDRGGRLYELLDVRGRGHYIGTVFSVMQTQAGWFGEGDESFFIDGAKEPSVHGTGTEDYFGDAYALHISPGLYAGTTVADGAGVGSRMTAYRWHVPDPVSFERSLRFGFEDAGFVLNADGSVKATFDERADFFSSVAFWYQQGVAAGLPSLPYGSRRLAHGNAIQIGAVPAAKRIRATGGTVEVKSDVGQGRGLVWFHPGDTGGELDLPFDAPSDGRFEMLLQSAAGPLFGRYEVSLDGQTLTAMSGKDDEAAGPAPVRVDGFATEFAVPRDQVLAWVELRQGAHRLTFRSVGKGELGLHALILSRVGSVPTEPADAKRARALGLLRNPPVAELARLLSNGDAEVRAAAVWALGQAKLAPAELLVALKDADPLVRGLAAVALRETRVEAHTTALIAALEDKDSSVRMIAAEALGRRRAAAAVPALIAVARTPGEHLHVLRNVVTALGEIGPGATGAIAALEELKANPRLRYPAGAAQKKITLKPE